MGVALVTGCSSGFGFWTAQELARAGHRVYAGVRNPRDGAVEAELRGEEDLPITTVRLDVRSESDAQQVTDLLLKREGGLDILVNNAGISMFGALEQVSLSLERDMFETNYFGPSRLIRLALPIMRARGGGHIVNVSSVAGWRPMPYLGTYSATKHAVDAMSFCLAAEVHDQNIRVTVVSPGGFRTAVGHNLSSPDIDPPGARYEEIRQARVAGWWKHVEGRDPREVALAIAQCVASNDPPIRIFVGEDAQSAAEMRSKLDDAELLAHLVSTLAGTDGTSTPTQPRVRRPRLDKRKL